jgi:hypothetical protein
MLDTMTPTFYAGATPIFGLAGRFALHASAVLQACSDTCPLVPPRSLGRAGVHVGRWRHSTAVASVTLSWRACRLLCAPRDPQHDQPVLELDMVLPTLTDPTDQPYKLVPIHW